MRHCAEVIKRYHIVVISPTHSGVLTSSLRMKSTASSDTLEKDSLLQSTLTCDTFRYVSCLSSPTNGDSPVTNMQAITPTLLSNAHAHKVQSKQRYQRDCALHTRKEGHAALFSSNTIFILGFHISAHLNFQMQIYCTLFYCFH